jgi:predicted homoserine dehydrogenase-like protein
LALLAMLGLAAFAVSAVARAQMRDDMQRFGRAAAVAGVSCNGWSDLDDDTRRDTASRLLIEQQHAAGDRDAGNFHRARHERVVRLTDDLTSLCSSSKDRAPVREVAGRAYRADVLLRPDAPLPVGE